MWRRRHMDGTRRECMLWGRSLADILGRRRGSVSWQRAPTKSVACVVSRLLGPQSSIGCCYEVLRSAVCVFVERARQSRGADAAQSMPRMHCERGRA